MANPKIRASTQDHLDIEDINDDLVVLKTGWVAMVMATTAINFDILSEAEQDATIYAYGALLNSLTFPLQILIRSKKADITAYFQHLGEAERTQTNPDLKRQIQQYQDFIQSTVQQKTVLDKKFYLIITFSPLEAGLKVLPSARPKTRPKAQLIADAKIALTPKRDHLIKQMARLGLSSRQLTTQELIELFYDIYNPAPLGTQRVLLDSASYTVPLVEPAIENPAPAPQKPEAAPLAQALPAEDLSSVLPPPENQSSLSQTVRPVPPQPSGPEAPLGRQPQPSQSEALQSQPPTDKPEGGRF